MAESKISSAPLTEGQSFEITPGMQALLNDGAACLRVAEAHEDFERFLLQLQRDSASETNMTTIGPVIVALRKVDDLMRVVKLRGEAQDQENKKITAP